MSQRTQSEARARRLGARALGAFMLAASLLATPAWAAKIVQVRVGNHPTFTRVVFELDGPAGYRVEERGSAAAPELLVTLDASSGARSIRSKSAGVSKVVVQPGKDASVARISLRKAGLRKDGVRLKEMILANPSRIVLDVMREEPKVAKKAAPKAAPTPPVAKTPAPKPAPAPKVAKVEPKPAPAPKVAKVEPKPAPEPKIAKPQPKPPIAKPPAPKRTPVQPAPTHTTRTPDTAKPEPAPEPKLAKVEPKPPFTPDLAEPKPEAPAKPRWKKPEAPKPTAPKVAKTPAPKSESSSGSSSWLSSPVLLGAGAGVLLCLIGFVLLMRRRRPLPVDLDVAAIGESEPAPGAVASQETLVGGGASAGDAAASFSDLFDDEPEQSSTAMPAAGRTSADKQIDDLFTGAEGAPESTGDASMNQAMSDLPADANRKGSPPSTPAAGGGAPDSDVLRVVHELERRMAQLETKLEEANEARDRLERQVAAQSEELRVQRAAIARTQRALRTMSRGDGEDKATEPALRDGDTQTKTRVVE